jgi:transposase-like protein
MSDAPIPWPVGKRGHHKAMAVFGALSEAIRRESVQAVAHWWGVSPQTVTAWRKAMGLTGQVPEGTSQLYRAYNQEPATVAGREKARARAKDPESGGRWRVGPWLCWCWAAPTT